MFRICKSAIGKEDIESFLTEIQDVLDQEDISREEAFTFLCAISEKCGWEINQILSDTIHEIEKKRVRRYFRRFLISEMYDILMDYPRGGSKEYCIVYADDRCIFVQSPHVIRNNMIIKPTSTIVLSPKGEIIVPEDTVYIYENSITAHGFTSRWNDLYGLYTMDGEMFLPCIFEYVEHKNSENYLFLRYKGIYYWLKYWADPLINSAGYRYKDIVLTISPQSRLLSFLPETKKYKLPKEQLKSVMAENSKELFGILDNYFHRLTIEELIEIEKNE